MTESPKAGVIDPEAIGRQLEVWCAVVGSAVAGVIAAFKLIQKALKEPAQEALATVEKVGDQAAANYSKLESLETRMGAMQGDLAKLKEEAQNERFAIRDIIQQREEHQAKRIERVFSLVDKMSDQMNELGDVVHSIQNEGRTNRKKDRTAAGLEEEER